MKLSATGAGADHKEQDMRQSPMKSFSGWNSDRAAVRRENQTKVRVQRQRKDGSWGAVTEMETFGVETPEQVVERMNKNNPHTSFRVAGVVTRTS